MPTADEFLALKSADILITLTTQSNARQKEMGDCVRGGSGEETSKQAKAISREDATIKGRLCGFVFAPNGSFSVGLGENKWMAALRIPH